MLDCFFLMHPTHYDAYMSSIVILQMPSISYELLMLLLLLLLQLFGTKSASLSAFDCLQG
jgi:hypothetical protein